MGLSQTLDPSLFSIQQQMDNPRQLLTKQHGEQRWGPEQTSEGPVGPGGWYEGPLGVQVHMGLQCVDRLGGGGRKRLCAPSQKCC